MFPDKQPGDALSAKHVNDLNMAARYALRDHPAGYGMGFGGAVANFPPTLVQRLIVVVEEFILGKADGITGLYEVRPRYWDKDSSSWKTDDSGHPSFLDATASDDTFKTGDKLCGVWDTLRDTWVVSGGSAPPIHVGKTDTAISKNSTGNVLVFEGNPLTWTGETTSALAFLSSVKADRWVYYVNIEGRNHIIAAECGL